MSTATRRSTLSWIAVLAMLLNALLPGWAHAMHHQAAANPTGDLCISGGMAGAAKQSPMATNSRDAQAKLQVDGDPAGACCLTCLTTADFGFLTAADAAAALPVPAAPAWVSASSPALFQHPGWNSGAARAPPAAHS